MGKTVYAHVAALNLNDLANFVLAFGNECESHGLTPKNVKVGEGAHG